MKHLLAILLLNSSSVVYVYDGDTFYVDLPACDLSVACDRVGIRVIGVDTPEIRGKCDKEKRLAVEARDYVERTLSESETIVLTDVERGKYYRLTARVWVHGEDLAQLLINKGYGRAYQGEQREGWCD